MTTLEKRDPVETLKGRLGRAIEVHRKVSASKTDVFATLNDLLLALALDSESPAVQAVARELVGTAELAAYTDEQARPVVQRILDGEFGEKPALAMTRVVLDLAHARGQVQALEREGATYVEWCAYWGAEDPNSCSFMPSYLITEVERLRAALAHHVDTQLTPATSVLPATPDRGGEKR